MGQALATILAAFLAAAVALSGYALTQAWNRRERRARTYAEALSAIRDYQELPYRIYRRQASDAETREMLGRLHSEVAARVRFYMAALEMESPLVSLAYRDLRNQTRGRGALYRHWAWQHAPIDSDAAMALDPPFHSDNDEEQRLCLACMRHDLKTFDRRRSHRLMAELDVLRRRRQAETPLSFDDIEQRFQRKRDQLSSQRGESRPSTASPAGP
ncbi:MAG TPA: hypothetical protein VMA72_03960 [Streptosporangiaceae bacterium]|nr:hypothetical protein [Streptosporangiaceae bacterium]